MGESPIAGRRGLPNCRFRPALLYSWEVRRVRLQAKILGYFGPLIAAAVLGAFWLVDLHMNNRVRSPARGELETSPRVFEELLATRAEGLITAASLVGELGVFYQPLEVTDPARLEVACQRINQLIG